MVSDELKIVGEKSGLSSAGAALIAIGVATPDYPKNIVIVLVGAGLIALRDYRNEKRKSPATKVEEKDDKEEPAKEKKD